MPPSAAPSRRLQSRPSRRSSGQLLLGCRRRQGARSSRRLTASSAADEVPRQLGHHPGQQPDLAPRADVAAAPLALSSAPNEVISRLPRRTGPVVTVLTPPTGHRFLVVATTPRARRRRTWNPYRAPLEVQFTDPTGPRTPLGLPRTAPRDRMPPRRALLGLRNGRQAFRGFPVPREIPALWVPACSLTCAPKSAGTTGVTVTGKRCPRRPPRPAPEGRPATRATAPPGRRRRGPRSSCTAPSKSGCRCPDHLRRLHGDAGGLLRQRVREARCVRDHRDRDGPGEAVGDVLGYVRRGACMSTPTTGVPTRRLAATGNRLRWCRGTPGPGRTGPRPARLARPRRSAASGTGVTGTDGPGLLAHRIAEIGNPGGLGRHRRGR